MAPSVAQLVPDTTQTVQKVITKVANLDLQADVCFILSLC